MDIQEIVSLFAVKENTKNHMVIFGGIMKQITKDMIRIYKIKELGHDFAGYKLQKGDIYTYHHNIIAKRNGGPETIWNGAILCGKTIHPYLHLIESVDPDIFYELTSEMIDENIKRKVDIENLRKIRDLLLYFENDHTHERSKKGKLLIKKEYLTNRIKL